MRICDSAIGATINARSTPISVAIRTVVATVAEFFRRGSSCEVDQPAGFATTSITDFNSARAITAAAATATALTTTTDIACIGVPDTTDGRAATGH